jgi:threonine/homoserine/homoserine lactone efflux protein
MVSQVMGVAMVGVLLGIATRLMDLSFLIKGLLVGFSIAAPVGPIGVLCIQRTISFGRISGLVTGLGAATADAFYGLVAAFGLTVISNFLVGEQFWFRLVGGIFLSYLGIKTFRSKPVERRTTAEHKGLLADYSSTVFLTLTNPMTILSFAAVFAGLGLGNSNESFLSAALLVTGVALGSAAWWLILSGVIGLIRTKIDAKSLAVVNKVSGLIILSFGVLALMSV